MAQAAAQPRRAPDSLAKARRQLSLVVSALALRYVEDPIDHWLLRDDGRLAHFAGDTESFLTLSVRHLLTGGGGSAVPLGAGNIRSK